MRLAASRDNGAACQSPGKGGDERDTGQTQASGDSRCGRRRLQPPDGRIVNTAGDSVLAEFESAVEAVRCAVEIQDALKTRNDALSEDQRMLFRIGVNLGDVMVSGDNLHGDGVNVAARLESVADPGGVSIASSVYDQ